MDIAIRAVVLYLFVVFLMRVIGRRELSTLSTIDLVLLIVLGDAIQQGLTQDDYSVTGAVIVISTFALLQVGLSYLGFRLPRLRPLLEGKPIVIVQDGKPIERNLHRERLAIEEVMEEARQQQIASVDQIEWAILESSGNISFIKKNGS
jgi:uncharacterized membrane protein YcaP (DUF421 family)